MKANEIYTKETGKSPKQTHYLNSVSMKSVD